ncbi:serine/threonine-protein kinase/endoribonuclease IRE1b-like protein [Tanacetum coccineum]
MDNETSFQFTRSFERKIGKLLVSDKEIGKGSNGTIVLEGVYDARCVAVKHILKVYHDVASKEIQILIESDEHTNIVRWHGVEYDQKHDRLVQSGERVKGQASVLSEICHVARVMISSEAVYNNSKFSSM